MAKDNSNNNRKDYVEEFNERYMLKPRSEKEIYWIADQLLEWAKKEDSITMLSFHAEYYITQSTMYEWENKYEHVRHSMKIARAMVGSRREKLALENKYNAGIVNRTLGIYDESVRAYDREMKMLSSQGEDKGQTINLVIPPMPSTDVVPKRGRKKKIEVEEATENV